VQRYPLRRDEHEREREEAELGHTSSVRATAGIAAVSEMSLTRV